MTRVPDLDNTSVGILLIYIILINLFFSIIMGGVEGTIIDSDSNQPIQGVNISYRSSGTTSYKNGNFFINAQEGEKIKFSHIGYRELELMAKTKWK